MGVYMTVHTPGWVGVMLQGTCIACSRGLSADRRTVRVGERLVEYFWKESSV